MLAVMNGRVRPPQNAGGHTRTSPAATVTAGHVHDWLCRIKAAPDLRLDRVVSARRAIASGQYDDNEYLDKLLNALMTEALITDR